MSSIVSSPKVLHVAETAQGGVGTYIDQIVPLQVADLGAMQVKVIGPAQHLKQIGSVDPNLLVSFDRPARSIASVIALSITIMRVSSEFKPDVIHAHSTFAGLIVRVAFAFRRHRPAIIYCPHGWAFAIYPNGFKRSAVQMVEHILAKFCDLVIAVSEDEAKCGRSIGIHHSKLRVVINGISAEAPIADGPAWEDHRLKVLFVGRFDRQKGFDILLRAIAGHEDTIAVHAAGTHVVNEKSSEHINQHHIEHLGWLTPGQLQTELEGADLLALPSRWEGLPLTPLEAMRAGRPVVACAVGGVPEVVIDGVTGRLTPPEDVEAFRSAILRDSAADRQRMGEAGRLRFLEHFTSDRLHRQIMDVYEQVLTDRLTNKSLSVTSQRVIK